jgi:formate dehydrogenase
MVIAVTATTVDWVKRRLESYFAGKPIRTEYLIVDKGELAGAGAHSYTKGDATKGSEAAVGVR